MQRLGKERTTLDLSRLMPKKGKKDVGYYCNCGPTVSGIKLGTFFNPEAQAITDRVAQLKTPQDQNTVEPDQPAGRETDPDSAAVLIDRFHQDFGTREDIEPDYACLLMEAGPGPEMEKEVSKIKNFDTISRNLPGKISSRTRLIMMKLGIIQTHGKGRNGVKPSYSSSKRWKTIRFGRRSLAHRCRKIVDA